MKKALNQCGQRQLANGIHCFGLDDSVLEEKNLHSAAQKMAGILVKGR